MDPNTRLIPLMDGIVEADPKVKLLKEAQRLKDYHQQWSQPIDNVWSRVGIKYVTGFKQRSFQKSRHFQFTFERHNGQVSTISQADLHNMNPADLLSLSNIVEQKKERSFALRYHLLILRQHLNLLVHDFGYIDYELHPNFPHAPPLQRPNLTPEEFEDPQPGLYQEPVRGIIFEDTEEDDDELHLFRFTEKHLFPSSFIQSFLIMVQESELPDEVKLSMSQELQWFLAVRKFWKRVLNTIDRR